MEPEINVLLPRFDYTGQLTDVNWTSIELWLPIDTLSKLIEMTIVKAIGNRLLQMTSFPKSSYHLVQIKDTTFIN